MSPSIKKSFAVLALLVLGSLSAQAARRTVVENPPPVIGNLDKPVLSAE